MIKKFLYSAAVATSLFAVAATASATTLSNWYVDSDGSGTTSSKVLVPDWLNFDGSSLIQNTFSSASTFSFKEVAIFNVTSTGIDPSVGLNPQITAKFSAEGTGVVGGNLTFSSGTLDLYSGSTKFGVLDLLGGTVALIAGGYVPNGIFTLGFKASSLDTGYLFDPAQNDLKAVVDDPKGLLFGYAASNAQERVGKTANAPLVTYFTDIFGAPVSTVDDGVKTLYIGNGGQYSMEIPEPSILSLLGLALFGVGFTTRRKTKA